MTRSNHALTGSPGFTFETKKIVVEGKPDSFDCWAIAYPEHKVSAPTEREAIEDATQLVRDLVLRGDVGSSY